MSGQMKVELKVLSMAVMRVLVTAVWTVVSRAGS